MRFIGIIFVGEFVRHFYKSELFGDTRLGVFLRVINGEFCFGNHRIMVEFQESEMSFW